MNNSNTFWDAASMDACPCNRCDGGNCSGYGCHRCTCVPAQRRTVKGAHKWADKQLAVAIIGRPA